MAKNLKRKEPTEPASRKLKVTSSSGKQSNLSSFFNGVPPVYPKVRSSSKPSVDKRCFCLLCYR